MSLLNVLISLLIAATLLAVSEELDRLPQVEDNDILVTEEAIRKIVNKLFFHINIDTNKTQRLKQYSTVHNYFSSIALKDYDNLKIIAQLTKTTNNNVYNDSKNVTTALNEALNETNFKSKASYNLNQQFREINLSKYLDSFINNLKPIQDTFTFKNEFINPENGTLNILENIRDIKLNINDSVDYISSNDLEVWDEGNAPPTGGRRIYQGQRTKIKYYQFMAAILVFGKFQCSGSIIHSDLIITAASCLQLAHNNRFYRENPAYLSVRVGSSFADLSGEIIEVLEVYFHPDYNPKTLRANLCILRLVRRLIFKRKNRKKVKKIDFDRSATALSVMTCSITVLGWGARTKANLLGNYAYLTVDQIPFYPLPDCQDVYSREYVTQRTFCGGYMSKGSGACNRDVGGPGIIGKLLVGIISFGSPSCGAVDSPTVFTKLGFYTDWIESIMEQDVPNIRQRTTSPPPSISEISTTKPTTTTFKMIPIDGSLEPIDIRVLSNSGLRSGSFGNVLNSLLKNDVNFAEGQLQTPNTIKEEPQNITVQKDTQKNSATKYTKIPSKFTSEVSDLDYMELVSTFPDKTNKGVTALGTNSLEEEFAIENHPDSDQQSEREIIHTSITQVKELTTKPNTERDTTIEINETTFLSTTLNNESVKYVTYSILPPKMSNESGNHSFMNKITTENSVLRIHVNNKSESNTLTDHFIRQAIDNLDLEKLINSITLQEPKSNVYENDHTENDILTLLYISEKERQQQLNDKNKVDLETENNISKQKNNISKSINNNESKLQPNLYGKNKQATTMDSLELEKAKSRIVEEIMKKELKDIVDDKRTLPKLDVDEKIDAAAQTFVDETIRDNENAPDEVNDDQTVDDLFEEGLDIDPPPKTNSYERAPSTRIYYEASNAEGERGLSIEMSNFTDYTFKYRAQDYDFMTKDEFYRLLNEVLEEE